MARLFDTLYERVLSKVVVLDWQNENGCHLYMGRLDKDGYGRINLRVPDPENPKRKKHVTKRTHQVIWEETNGPLPVGMTLDHLDCIANACCNQDHLECVTRVVNSQRSQAKRKRNAMQAG